MKLSIKISSVNVTKSAVSCGFGRHRVHWVINPPQKTPPPSSQIRLLNLQTVQAPLLGNSSLCIGFL